MATQTDTEQQVRHRLAPPYRVLLHNDDEHDMTFVVVALQRSVPGLAHESAVAIMIEAHTTGVGLVTVCPRETAEYYADRIRTYGLMASIEADGQ